MRSLRREKVPCCRVDGSAYLPGAMRSATLFTLLLATACGGAEDPAATEPTPADTTGPSAADPGTDPEEGTSPGVAATEPGAASEADESDRADGELAGQYDATLEHVRVSGPCPATPRQTGVATITVTGPDIRLPLGEGFRCEPSNACDFRGSLGDPLPLSNAGTADDEGGQFRTDMELSPETLRATGTSSYTMPGLVCRWNTTLTLHPTP